MAKRKGTVSKIGKSQYSFYIQLDSDGFYFNTKYDPKCGIGDTVGITFDKKNDQRGQITDVKLLNDSGSPKGFQGNPGGGGGGGYKAEPGRQDSIVYQSSRKDALVLAGLIVSNEAIKLPKAADARRTVIEELVTETTARFFADASDPKAAIKGAQDVEDDAGGDDAWGDDSKSEEDFNDEWD